MADEIENETTEREIPVSLPMRDYGIWLTQGITDTVRRGKLVERIGQLGAEVVDQYPADPQTGDRSFRFDREKVCERLLADGLMTRDEIYGGILDGEEETLRERLGTPEPEPEPDSISEDEAALRARTQRAWMASEGHILHNRHDADEWERRGEGLLAAINRHGIRVDMGTLHIGSMAAAVFELLQLKGLVTEHEARAAKNKAAHDGLAQILLRVEAEADQRKEQQRAAQSAPVVAQRPKLIVPGRDA